MTPPRGLDLPPSVMGNHRWRDPVLRFVGKKAVLVGEANPYGGNPDLALYPSPPGSAGHRLCHKVLGLTPDEYRRDFARVNLCGVSWRLAEARGRARFLVDVPGLPLVLLGAKVCQAFGVPFEPFTQGAAARAGARDALLVVLPHPSGLSRAWNADGAFLRARAAVADLLVRESSRPVSGP